jgi:Divergent InlB B-repeat domain
MRRLLAVLVVVACGVLVIPGIASAADTWSAPTDLATTSYLTSVSCASASFCAATDVFGDTYMYYGGADWTAPEPLDTSGGVSAPYVPVSVSCSSASFCLAVGYDQNFTSYAYTYDGSSWSAPTPVAGESSYAEGTQMQSVSCVSASFCMAVDAYGAAFVYSGDPASWSPPTTIGFGVNNNLTSVSCSSTNFCVAVDNQGYAYTYSTGSWGLPVQISTAIPLSSVSCASLTFCIAVDVNGNTYSFNGSQWSAPQSTPTNQGLSSVSCPSADFCAAAGSDKNDYAAAYTYTTTDPTWTGGNLPSMAINAPLYSISCVSETFCAAITGGDVLTYGVPTPTLQTLGTSIVGSGSGNISSSPSGISCDLTCSAQFDKASQVTLSATPGSGSTFAGWSGGGCSGTQTTCQVTMNDDENVSAAFDATPQTLTVSVAGSGSGTVKSSPSRISCGSTCSAQFNQTSHVTLTATPASGSAFAGWSGAGCSGTQMTCQVTMNADENITATFNPTTTTGTPPASSAPVQTTTTPSASTLLAVTAISLTGKRLTWCWGTGCQYPNTRFIFRLNEAATLRLVLYRHDHAGWARHAIANVRGHAGLNRHRLAGRWRGAPVATGPVQIAFQIKSDGRWKTKMTLRLTVRHDHRS